MTISRPRMVVCAAVIAAVLAFLPVRPASPYDPARDKECVAGPCQNSPPSRQERDAPPPKTRPTDVDTMREVPAEKHWKYREAMDALRRGDLKQAADALTMLNAWYGGRDQELQRKLKDVRALYAKQLDEQGRASMRQGAFGDAARRFRDAAQQYDQYTTQQEEYEHLAREAARREREWTDQIPVTSSIPNETRRLEDRKRELQEIATRLNRAVRESKPNDYLATRERLLSEKAHLEAALKILATRWLANSPASAIDQQRDVVLKQIREDLRSLLQRVLTASINVMIADVRTLTPFQWETGWSREAKLQIARDSESQLRAVGESAERDLYDPRAFTQTDYGALVFESGDALRQAQKINIEGRWRGL